MRDCLSTYFSYLSLTSSNSFTSEKCN